MSVTCLNGCPLVCRIRISRTCALRAFFLDDETRRKAALRTCFEFNCHSKRTRYIICEYRSSLQRCPDYSYGRRPRCFRLDSDCIPSGVVAKVMPSMEDVVAQEAVILCNEFIHYKLQQLGLVRKGRTAPNTKTYDSTAATNTTKSQSGPTLHETMLELQLVSAELEQLYPTLFHGVFGQLNITRVSSEEVAEEAFHSVADELFRAGITWARVVAMFAVAGALAVECVQQRSYDYTAFVDRLVASLTRFVRERLVSWIARQGGWSDMAKTFHGTKEDDSYVLMTIGVLGALCGLAGTIVATSKLQVSL
ncbi:bcl-2-related ovarian killer protein-like isoform X2 [Acanthaster planci]|uniref:Bcl-2-related ovarian killer protein-like isoform X2 n=1 Tax=Acanthaster planci TaxID=133434 RepID=A0A8B7YPT1_ACAPL|nr:bcl-2-related ovarian killer protein-like isoform X2 [Acanthaster planci]